MWRGNFGLGQNQRILFNSRGATIHKHFSNENRIFEYWNVNVYQGLKNGTNLSHKNLNDIILPNNSVDSISPEKTRQNLMGVMFVHVNSSNNMLFTRLELKNIFSVSANFYGFILIVIYLRTNIKNGIPTMRERVGIHIAHQMTHLHKRNGVVVLVISCRVLRHTHEYVCITEPFIKLHPKKWCRCRRPRNNYRLLLSGAALLYWI